MKGDSEPRSDSPQADPLLADVAAIARIGVTPTILEVICRTTGMGFAAVARVTSDRWVACDVRDEIDFGLKPGGELQVATTICSEIRESGHAVVIDHVADDEAWCGHRTPALYGFQSYISTPIVLRNGAFFGTLCAIDPRPARLNRSEVVDMFRMFADLIAFHLDANDRLAASEADLLDAREAAELREQFIAVLGHDLRNPLAAIDGGVHLLLRTALPQRSANIARLMRVSVGRMSTLIDNVLDFARGRLGGGLVVQRQAVAIGPLLNDLMAESLAGAPDRRIELDADEAGVVLADRSRLAQLVSNLIGNALTHGAADQPVRIRAAMTDAGLELSVCNGGEQIPARTLERLFQPFARGHERGGEQGLGLGLYIAAEIAKAHSGTLTVASTPEETCFTFRMPAEPAVPELS